MRSGLIVLVPGKMMGKTIPLNGPHFFIGRDPRCHLRPASATVSNCHCALITRHGRLFVLDFDSTNGTYVNDEWVTCATELHDGDELRVGPLVLQVSTEADPVVEDFETRVPAGTDEDEEAASGILFSLPDEKGLDIRNGPTKLNLKENLPTLSREPQVQPVQAPTSSPAAAANAILKEYRRRHRQAALR